MKRALLSAVPLFLLVVAAVTVSAQLGTVNCKYGSTAPSTVQGPVIQPSETAVYPNADYATGGVGLRNQPQRSILISGSPTNAAIDAIVYWSVLGPIVKQDYFITVQRLFPNPTTLPNQTTLLGTLIAVGGDPCWGSSGNYIFKAHVPTSVVTGNGNYLIKFAAGASGLMTGDDPWTKSSFPAMEGAALVVVKNGVHTVSVFDGQAGLTFSSSLTYTLQLLLPTQGQVLWDNIGADGQIGYSRNPGAGGETTTINGTLIAGPGAQNTDADWSGTAALPLPQLFDVTGHDISGAAPAGTTSLSVQFQSPGDCVTTIANVVSQ
jgi:hypothetical protein